VEDLPPVGGSVAPGAVAAPPPHPIVTMSIPATADTARAFAMFIAVVSWLLHEERRWFPFRVNCGAQTSHGWRQLKSNFYRGGSL
jgi:hypothetical protein